MCYIGNILTTAAFFLPTVLDYPQESPPMPNIYTRTAYAPRNAVYDGLKVISAGPFDLF